MVKEIVKDEEILKQKSRNFSFSGQDKEIIVDLLDTANKHLEECAGLAAIQINYPVKAFVMKVGDTFVPVINPVTVKKSPETYVATERCLSLEGERQVKRYQWIDVIYFTQSGKIIKKRLSGYIAEIFQHENDHLYGIII